MKKVLIFGGSGMVGRHLIRKLTKNNHLVTVVTRNLHKKGAILKKELLCVKIPSPDELDKDCFSPDKINKLIG